MKLVPDAPLRVPAADLEGVLARAHRTLVVFETPNCEPCLRLEPILDDLAREYRGRVLVVRVDASEGWLAARHHLSYVPTLTFWERGAEHARIRGNPGPDAVRAHVDCFVSGAEVPEPASGARHALVAAFGVAARRARPRTLLSGSAAKA
jgi:thioredoxin-like negative regulator of GroEL